MMAYTESKQFERVALPFFYLAIAASMLFTVVALGTILAVGLGLF